MSQRRVAPSEVVARRRRSACVTAAAIFVSLGLTGCSDVERGIGATLEEFAASRAAAELATELDQLDGVGYVAIDYNAVASRLHVQLVLTGEPGSERSNWRTALDAVLAAEAEPDLAGSAAAATVLTEGGGGLALSPGTLGAEGTRPTVDGWLDLLDIAPVNVMVEGGGEAGIAVEVSTVGLSGSESSARLERVASAAGIERQAATMTAGDLGRLLAGLRGLDIESASDSWFLPGLISVSGRAAASEQLDTAQAILASIESTAPLAVTSTLDAPEGLFMTTSPVGLSVSWHADQQIDARDARALDAWPTLRAIVASIPLSTGASVSLMAPGGGASLVLGTCDGTLGDGTAIGQALVDALRSDLALPADAIAAGHCTPGP